MTPFPPVKPSQTRESLIGYFAYWLGGWNASLHRDGTASAGRLSGDSVTLDDNAFAQWVINQVQEGQKQRYDREISALKCEVYDLQKRLEREKEHAKNHEAGYDNYRLIYDIICAIMRAPKDVRRKYGKDFILNLEKMDMEFLENFKNEFSDATLDRFAADNSL